MLKQICELFASGYKTSVIGTFITNIQVAARKSWDVSAIGSFVSGHAGELAVNQNVLNKIKLPLLTLPKFLKTSAIVNLALRFNIIFAILLFVAPFAPTMVCAGIALLALASFMFSGKRIRQKSAVSFFVAAFLLLTFIYSLTSPDITGSLKIWLIYAAFIGMYFIARQSVITKKDLLRSCYILSISGFLVSIYGIYQNFFGSNVGNAWLDEEMFTDISVRVYSTLGNPNVLGEYLLLTIPVTVGLIWNRLKTTKFPKGKQFFIIVAFLIIAATQLLCIIYTQSRGCWLALALAAFIFIIFVDKRFLVFAFIALFLAPALLPQSIIDRFTSIGNLGDSSTSYRVYIWLGTLNMLEHFWLTGVGLGAVAFAKVYPFYSYSAVIAPHAHNIYLETISEMGIVGLFILFAIVVFYILKTLNVYVNSIKTKRIVISIAMLAGISAFMFQGLFDYVWYNYRVFLIFWMYLGIATRVNDMRNIA